MSDLSGSATLSSTSKTYFVPSFSDTINVLPSARATAEITFSWDPTDGQFSYVVGVTTVIPEGATYTAVGEEITFTADVVYLPAGRSAIEYFWDFGDGTTGYGSTVTHTYVIANLQAACVLRVTDNHGDQYYCRKQLYLHIPEEEEE